MHLSLRNTPEQMDKINGDGEKGGEMSIKSTIIMIGFILLFVVGIIVGTKITERRFEKEGVNGDYFCVYIGGNIRCFDNVLDDWGKGGGQ